MTRALCGTSRSVATVVLVATMQYLLAAVPSVEPPRFTRFAVELQRTDRWRYGYMLQHHGAVLVKARRAESDAAFVAPDPSDKIASLMLRELRSRPWKAALELLFYAALFGLWKAGWPRLVRVLGADRSRIRWSVSAGFAGTLFVSTALTPFLLAGYGEPLFSTLVGPGALSSSALLPRTTSGFMPSVSYGMVLQNVVLIWPMMATQLFKAGDTVDAISSIVGLRRALWMVASLFWGLVTTAVSWLLNTGREPDGHM